MTEEQLKALHGWQAAIKAAARLSETPRTDALDRGLYGYSDYARVLPKIFALARELELRVIELEQDLRLNASMLAKQCDMAREAETVRKA